jgi:hypothetical protein
VDDCATAVSRYLLRAGSHWAQHEMLHGSADFFMETVMSHKLTLVAITATLAVCSFLAAQVTPIPVSPDANSDLSQEDTQVIMQAKLASAQEVLAGLVTQDFESIESAASVLSKISLSPPPKFEKSGAESSDEIYEHFRLEFARLAGQLQRHARNRELEATAYVQQNMTATCIACHDFIRDHP